MTRRRAASGFTLLEIAVALAILGVGVVTCMQIFTGSLRLQDRASRQTLVVMYARGLMDVYLKAGEHVESTEEPAATAEGFRAKTRTWKCRADDGVDPRLLELSSEMELWCFQVDVTWQDGTGAKTYTLRSMRAAPERL